MHNNLGFAFLNVVYISGVDQHNDKAKYVNRTCHYLGDSIIFLFLCIFLNSSKKLLPYLHLKRRSTNTNICLITLETHLVRMSKILKTVG